MKPKNGKAKSKRTSLGVKYMTERKVKEAHRKQRKIDRINKLKGKKKKDPGIPNLYPFKEAMIRKEEERRAREESKKERQRRVAAAARVQRKSKHAPMTLEEMAADAAARGDAYEVGEDLAAAAADDMGEAVGGLPEASRKAYYKEFVKVVEAADVILEVLDARDPIGCRCRRVEQQVLAAGSDKRLVLVLNKIDLVPKEVVERWLKYLRNDFPTIAFKASTQEKASKLMQSAHAAVGGRRSGASGCFGAQSLISLLGNFCRNRGIRTAIRVGVIGYPNVGKSSLINSLKRGRVCGVGATPGVTKSCQEIALDKHVKLIDSPGIVFGDQTDSSSDLILRNCVRLEDLADPLPAVTSILGRCDPEMIMELYMVPAFSGTDEFLLHVARRLGKIKKGGIPDPEAAARAILQDWNQGKISYYTVPPETSEHESHVSAEFVSAWGEEFEIDAATHDEETRLVDATMDDAADGAPVLPLHSAVDLTDSHSSGYDFSLLGST